MKPMIAVSQYKVAQLTSDHHSCLDQVQELLDEHAQEGWELVTALRALPPDVSLHDPTLLELFLSQNTNCNKN
jgi:hypothetical protein